MDQKKTIIVNEEIDYIIRNIEAVKALLECYEIAKSKFPQWLKQCIYEKIKTKLDSGDMSFLESPKLELEDETIFLFPEDKFYLQRNDDFYLGLYWGIEYFKWEEIDISSLDKGMWCFLYYDVPENYKKKKKIKTSIENWENKLIKYVKNFKCPNLNLQKFPNDEDEQYLIAYQLGHVLNIKEISQEPEKVIDRVAELFIQFVKDTLPIVKNNPLPEKLYFE